MGGGGGATTPLALKQEGHVFSESLFAPGRGFIKQHGIRQASEARVGGGVGEVGNSGRPEKRRGRESVCSG